jgi:hypothetical protein
LVGCVWSGFSWLGTGTGGGFLWTRRWTFGFWCHGVSLPFWFYTFRKSVWRWFVIAEDWNPSAWTVLVFSYVELWAKFHLGREWWCATEMITASTTNIIFLSTHSGVK